MIRKDTAVSAVVRAVVCRPVLCGRPSTPSSGSRRCTSRRGCAFEFSITPEYWYPLLVASALVVVCHVSIGWFRGPYGIGYDLASFEETSDLAGTAVQTGVTLGFLVVALNAIDLPRASRSPASRWPWPACSPHASSSGPGGRTGDRATPSAGRLSSVPVRAGASSYRAWSGVLGAVCCPSPCWMTTPARRGCSSRVFGSGHPGRPRAGGGTPSGQHRGHRRTERHTGCGARLSAVARDRGLEVLVLPPFREILDGRPTESDLRNLDVADLLGRQPVDLDMSAIANEISGRRVLVTGAGGSIGSELCRQLMRFGPDRLHMLDRDESGLHSTQLSLDGRALLDADELVLCDIRDAEAVTRAFRQARPDVVFHAAALKHLTMLERHPDEAFKTNVVGSLNVLEAARCAGVQTFVNISTDKAAGPTCVLGWSKRVAERLTAGYDGSGGGRYVSVRFGNVLGSRGSVVPVFMEQIRRGGPVTVTHPEVERYFMLIPEACQLVLQAGAIGTGGEVMVLDMGTPVRIVDVARTMIGLSGRTDVDIVFTGLRRGEKVTEELFTPGELVLTSTHPLILHVSVPPLDPGRLLDGARAQDERALRDWFTAHGGQRLVRAVS